MLHFRARILTERREFSPAAKLCFGRAVFLCGIGFHTGAVQEVPIAFAHEKGWLYSIKEMEKVYRAWYDGENPVACR
jgi:hypothetical protein